MKKLITVMFIAVLAASVFALDINVGVDPLHSFDASASVLVHLGKFELGAGAYTDAVSTIVREAKKYTKENALENIKAAFTGANYGLMGQAYFNILNGNLKLGVGAIADLGSVTQVKQEATDRHFACTLLAAAKIKYAFIGNSGIFASAGVPVVSYDSLAEKSESFTTLFTGDKSEIIPYIKNNARISLGMSFSI